MWEAPHQCVSNSGGVDTTGFIMCPAGQEVSEEASLLPGLFIQRLVHEVPSLQDALNLYNTTKKEHQYVGAALQAAEAGVSVVANTALPLTHPLVNHVGGWSTLDQWACQGLDHVEQVVPIITQPTKEVINRTHAFVLKTIAGQGEDTLQPIPPSTLSGALTTRALNTARVVAGTHAGMAVAGAAHRLLDTANTIVNTLLPVEKWDHIVLDHDGRGGDFGVRLIVLKEKCRRRMKARLSDILHVNHSQPLNPDDLDITVGHLVELTRRLMMDWHTRLSKQVYASKVFQCAKTRGTMALDWMNVILSTLQARAGTVWTLIIDMAGRVQTIMFSSPAGPLLMAGVDVASEVGKKSVEMARNGVDIVTAVLRYNIMMTKGTVLVIDGMVRGTVKEMTDWSVDAMDRVTRRGNLVVSGRVSATKKAAISTTQATLTAVAIVFGTAQHVMTDVISLGGSIGRQGINVVRNVWCSNTKILLRICTSNQKFLPGSKYLLHLSSLLGIPYIWITAASCHGTQHHQQHPEPTTSNCICSQDLQESPVASKSLEDAQKYNIKEHMKIMPQLKEEKEEAMEKEENEQVKEMLERMKSEDENDSDEQEQYLPVEEEYL